MQLQKIVIKMKLKKNLTFVILLVSILNLNAKSSDTLKAENNNEKLITLSEINSLVINNRELVLSKLNQEISSDNLKSNKNSLLPDIGLNGDSFYGNSLILSKMNRDQKSNFAYQVQLYAEYELYSGGINRSRIAQMVHRKTLSDLETKYIEQEVLLEAYILLYDIYRNMNYSTLINSSIYLRQKEYERIEELYKNGLVLKSDLLRSKLYITDLQRDEVTIQNSIDILSNQLCTLLNLEKDVNIVPSIEADLNYKILSSFDDLYEYALENSQIIKMNKTSVEIEKEKLNEVKSQNLPSFKLYANYGIGNINPAFKYNNQAYGEVGAKLNISIDSYYKIPSELKSQKLNINRGLVNLENETDILKHNLFELYTRYNEALINIERAKEKIKMSLESARILRNSYFNQQSLLIDVLEAETKSIESSFELVEATVDAQKYYWAIQKVAGKL